MQSSFTTPHKALSLLSSEREILRVIHRHGRISRAHITRETHLAQQSVHRLVEGLMAKKLVTQSDPVIAGRGKPSPQLEIESETHISLGLAITTNAIKLSAASAHGDLVYDGRVEGDPNDVNGVLLAVGNAIKALFASGGALEGRDNIGLGIAMQGYRLGDPNRYVTPTPIANWRDIAINDLFQTTLGLPCFSENNANCSAVAEYYCGDGKQYGCFAYLSFNHGFGGGLIYHSTPFFGGHGNAGELTRLFALHERDSRPAMGELLKRLRKNNIELKTISELAQRYDPDWPGVAEWIEEITPALRLTVRALMATSDPNAIIFGGEAPDLLRASMIAASHDPTLKESPMPILAPSAIKGDPSAIGAAFLPLQKLLFAQEDF